MIVDLFAGGGGASTGIEAATGRSVDIAINHDEIAIAVHAANHPDTEHYRTNVWDVKPRVATRGRKVRLLWASPDCKHFSIAKGGKPKEHGIRSLAWVVRDWARDVRPDIICLENVREFLDWGPLDSKDQPIKDRKGETFNQWRGALELLGYAVDWRILDASHFGAPTKRKRLFLIARCDGQPIVWPAATHGPGLKPLHTAAECIDWDIPCPSIFGRKKPLAEKTMARIAHGLRRFVLQNPQPFIVKVNHGDDAKTGSRTNSLDEPLTTITAANRGHAIVAPVFATIDHRTKTEAASSPEAPLPTSTTKARHVLVAPTLVQTGYGEREGQSPRVLDLHEPMGTLVGGGVKQGLVFAWLAKHFGGEVGIPVTQPFSTVTAVDHHGLCAASLVKLRGECAGADMNEPAPTITAGGMHLAEVRAFLISYYSAQQAPDITKPLATITTRERLGIVLVHGVEYQIVDICMRMLEPHELLRAQFGRFAAGYDMREAKILKGPKKGQPSKKAYVRLVGNSVCPEVAEAVVRANYFTTQARRAA